ncbi:MAG: hypothetical protein GY800_14450 [Planctomycetes bacterium]|nr:hypothetical protein [Planctomycetota bacterium]
MEYKTQYHPKVISRSRVKASLPYLFLCLLFSAGFLFLPSSSYAQFPVPKHGEHVWPVGIIQTTDGGYFVVGGALKPQDPTQTDTWAAKMDASGRIQWINFYGGSNSDLANSLVQTSDGGFIVAGYIYKPATKLSDGWILKLDANGNQQWQKSYGSAKDDVFNSVLQTSDGGYVLAGGSWAIGGTGSDGWVLKLTSSGSVEWQKTLGGGGGGDDFISSVAQTGDGGYIVVGDTVLATGDINGWIVRLNAMGGKQWERTAGGSAKDEINAVWATTDGGFVVAGSSYSFGSGTEDLWVVKLSSTGATDWEHTFGGEGADEALAVQETADGGFIVAGQTSSYGSTTDGWVIKLDSAGNVMWMQTYGEELYDVITDIQQTADGGYIISGGSYLFAANGEDLGRETWVAKVDAQGNVEWLNSTWGD